MPVRRMGFRMVSKRMKISCFVPTMYSPYNRFRSRSLPIGESSGNLAQRLITL
jgi:hypothetical protein